jgi:SAM-dependent methyltransferase
MERDGKERARRTWGSSPTGWTSAPGAEPGTPEFFERALKFRSQYEQPWLPEVVPFGAMKGKRVLEVGFGPGYDAFALMQNGAIYSGIDIAPENVERTLKHLAPYGLHPDVREADAEALPFSDASFDVVYSNGVLHHVPDIAKAILEVRRVLKPGGSLYVILYHRNSIFYRFTLPLIWLIEGSWRRESLAQRLRRIEANAAGETPIVNVYSRAEVADLVARCGFRVQWLGVRKLVIEDLPWLPIIRNAYRAIPRRLLDATGKALGWYVIVHATRPHEAPS